MGDWKVFAEDEGTGLSTQHYRDSGDGAHFNAQSHIPNATDFAVHEPLIEVDWDANTISFSKAQYRISATNITSRQRNGEQVKWPEVTFTVYSPESIVTFPDEKNSEIYVDINIEDTDGDDGQYTVRDPGDAPPDPSLLIASVDWENQHVSYENANPTGEYNEVLLNDVRSIRYDNKADSLVVDHRPDGGDTAYEVVTTEDLDEILEENDDDGAVTKKAVISTDEPESAVVFNTQGRDTITISVESDTKATYAIDASVDEDDWLNGWEVFGPTDGHRDTYHTGMPFIRVRVDDPSDDEGEATVILSGS